MRTMICENQVGNTEMIGNLIKQEKSNDFSIILKSGNGFIPFLEIVDRNYNVVVSINRSGIACYKIYYLFRERTKENDWMQKGQDGHAFS